MNLTFNRTIVELKYHTVTDFEEAEVAFNRTIVELKFGLNFKRTSPLNLLIVP